MSQVEAVCHVYPPQSPQHLFVSLGFFPGLAALAILYSHPTELLFKCHLVDSFTSVLPLLPGSVGQAMGVLFPQTSDRRYTCASGQRVRKVS